MSRCPFAKGAFIVVVYALAAPAFADPSPVQEWPVDPVLGVAITQSPELFPNLELTGFRMTRRVNLAASTCVATVRLPARGAEGTDEANVLTCQFVHDREPQDKQPNITSSLRLPFGTAPLAVWGNRSSIEHRAARRLPQIFQMQNDPLVISLHAALKYMYKRQPQIQTMSSCTPDGRRCDSSYSIASDPDDEYSPSYLNCTADLQDGVLSRAHCNFYYPNRE